MPKRKYLKAFCRRKKHLSNTIDGYHIQAVFIPEDSDENCTDTNDSSSSSSDESDLLSGSECDLDSFQSCQEALENYPTNCKKLEDNYVYQWIDGETKYPDNLSNEILLTQEDKNRILSSSLTNLFEIFFSNSLKKYIIDCTSEQGYELTSDRLDTFIGIVILSALNQRLSQKDYWSEDSFLGCDPVATAMERREFKDIKSKLNFHKPSDENVNDKAWRVRHVMNIFNDNAKSFGYFCTALCVGEMMMKFCNEIRFKKYYEIKPIIFGIKEWALCSSNGYLFHCDLYCGQDKTAEIAQGSQVVLQMLQDFLTKIPPQDRLQYHIYFGQLFCTPDLLVNLQKQNLRATGIVKEDRIQEPNEIDAKAKKGTSQVKYDKNSGINYITIMDSEPVSILSSAAGLTPISKVTCYDKKVKKDVEIPLPNAFHVYEKFKGGVDLHDQHCDYLTSVFRSNKWTWIVFVRLIHASMTNAMVLYNSASGNKKKLKMYDIALEVCNDYFTRSNKSHE